MHKKLMYICLMYSKELVKGTLKTIILQLLTSSGKMYGYEITQKVKLRTNNKIQLTEGALYPTLHRLEADGMLTTETINYNGRKRKYYTVTTTGTENALSLTDEFRDFAQTMLSLLHPKPLNT